jgi:hypothetical protein
MLKLFKLFEVSNSLLCEWLGVDYQKIFNGELQVQQSYLQNYLPDFMLSDQFEVIKFYVNCDQNFIQLVGFDLVFIYFFIFYFRFKAF